MKTPDVNHVDKILPVECGRYRVETVHGIRLNAIYKGDGHWIQDTTFISDDVPIPDVA